MAVEVTLEADKRLTRECFKQALLALGVSDLQEQRGTLSALFPRSGMTVVHRDEVEDSEALTMGMEKKNGVSEGTYCRCCEKHLLQRKLFVRRLPLFAGSASLK